ADLGVEREIVLDVTPAPRIDALALDALGQQLAVGVGRGELQVFDVRSGEMRERRACDGFARGLAWLDDGRLLCVGSGGSLAGLGGDAVVFSGGGLELDAQPDGRRLLVQST